MFVYVLNLDCKMYFSFVNFLTYGSQGMSLHTSTNDNQTIIWRSPNIYPSSIGPNSGLLGIKAVSCNGCDKIEPLPHCQ